VVLVEISAAAFDTSAARALMSEMIAENESASELAPSFMSRRFPS